MYCYMYVLHVLFCPGTCKHSPMLSCIMSKCNKDSHSRIFSIWLQTNFYLVFALRLATLAAVKRHRWERLEIVLATCCALRPVPDVVIRLQMEHKVFLLVVHLAAIGTDHLTKRQENRYRWNANIQARKIMYSGYFRSRNVNMRLVYSMLLKGCTYLLEVLVCMHVHVHANVNELIR